VAITIENALEYERGISDRDQETKQRRYLESRKFAPNLGRSLGRAPL
jgi:hypothetical protein